MPITPQSPLRGGALGGASAAAVERALGLRTVGELLRHYPRRYVERGELTDLSDLRVGEDVTVVAEVREVRLRNLRPRPGERRRRTLLEIKVGDGTHSIDVKFFNKHWLEKTLQVGTRGLFAGTVSQFNRTRELTNPDFALLDDDPAGAGGTEEAAEFAARPVPIYPTARKLPVRTIETCIKHVLSVLEPIDDPLPAALRGKHRLVGYMTAVHDIHQPPDSRAIGAARKRLKWDEAIALQVALAQRRHAAAARSAIARPARAGGLLDAFDAQLPFELTAGQQEVGGQIAAELGESHPMHRLLQGEVGSGKTVVAIRAMLQVVDAGGQAALLAPTEVLAVQHARSLAALLGPLARAGELDGAEQATRIALLTGSLTAPVRRAALAAAADGTAGIVVGTHALIQEGVAFADLGLVVVDEQHRFGVEQRDALRGKAADPPHVLVMTATPIPRTVAMTVFGDLETSSLRELPRGRSPISTSVVPADNPRWIDRMWERVREEVAAGHRAYVVCPRIGAAGGTDSDGADPDLGGPDDGDDPDLTDLPAEDAAARRPAAAVLEVAPALADGPLHGLQVGILHGRLPAEEKDDVMRRFAAGDLDVLVATTVIEVGVDVSAATAMVVLDADRFGVSQLHQLRGRVGRGDAGGVCLLVTGSAADTPAGERLAAVAATTDGFRLARVDLEQRREGDVLGASQSGRRSQLAMLSLLRDEDLIVEARGEATAIVAADPELTGNRTLADAVAAYVEDDRADYLEKT